MVKGRRGAKGGEKEERRMEASAAAKASGRRPLSRRKRAGEREAEAHRDLQRAADRKTERTREQQDEQSAQQAVQPPDREYPSNPLPEQHQAKPGRESELDPRPAYLAPNYRGSGKLQDMAALVTGGDSGIGRAVAVLYAREGADVAIVYLSEHDDAEETREAVEREGRRCLLIPGDVSDPRFCREAVERTVREFGKLDILVNNAAFQQHAERLEDISDEQWDRTFRTNIYGYFYMARAALEHLGEGGVILNSGSITGMEGSKQLLDYSATKGAIHAFTKSLAQNVLDRGIRVNAVAPGPIWTPLNPADQPADKVKEFGANQPMRRPGQPEEVAPAYVFLAASSDSSYISGEVLPVLGGQTHA